MKMKIDAFVGRSDELARLRESCVGRTSFVVVTGRRRIGKSRLIQEFSKDFVRYFEFIGLPPERGVTARDQKREFIRLLATQSDLPIEMEIDDWGRLFELLSKQIPSEPTLLFLDEVSWMAHRDPTFLGKLKNAWDLYFSRMPGLTLVVCGSLSSWLEDNILSSTGFIGRVSLTLRIKELGLSSCRKFWGPYEERISASEKLKVLALTGGIPRYLEEIDPTKNFRENIARLCFKDGAFFFEEYERLFSDLFGAKTKGLKGIVSVLSSGSKTPQDIAGLLGRSLGGSFYHDIDILEQSGFIRADYSWHFKTSHRGRHFKLRLSDNYLRFYLKCIGPDKERIRAETFPIGTLFTEPRWYALLGLQFENLVLNNRREILAALGIEIQDVLNDGPYFQKQSASKPAVQTDYMIQTRFNTLYLCEVKSSRDRIGTEVVKQVEHTMKALSVQKKYTIRPVLIYSGQISDEIVDSRFFDKVLDVGMLL